MALIKSLKGQQNDWKQFYCHSGSYANKKFKNKINTGAIY
ncbi:hypothetical protein J644_0980 [Acinetobacter baumannii 480175]|nr:hypothetical protein J644_0980 [Acinetobacter baumannii 480175]